MTLRLRRTPWRPSPGYLARRPEEIENLGGDPTEMWAEAPEPERVTTLDRLLARIPERLSLTARWCLLDGRSQGEVAGRLGITQPSVSLRLGVARQRMRAVAELGCDYTPEEAEDRILRAGGSAEDARMVAIYWMEHSTRATARLIGRSQAYTYEHIHGRLSRWRSLPGVSDIADAVDTIGRRPGPFSQWAPPRR